MSNTDKLRYSMLIQWSDEDNKYLVRLPEWRHEIQRFVTHGDTYEEAAKNGREILEMLIKNAQGELPDPRKAAYAWTEEDEALYNAPDEETENLIITGSDEDNAERYQVSAVNKVLARQTGKPQDDDIDDENRCIIEEDRRAIEEARQDDAVMSAIYLWNATLKRLQTELAPAVFTTWFQGSTALSLQNSVLTVRAATLFTKTQLEGRFSDTVCSIASEIAGVPIEVRFVVSD